MVRKATERKRTESTKLKQACIFGTMTVYKGCMVIYNKIFIFVIYVFSFIVKPKSSLSSIDYFSSVKKKVDAQIKGYMDMDMIKKKAYNFFLKSQNIIENII